MDFAGGDSFSAGSDMPEGSWRGRHRKPQMVTRHCHWDQFISLLGQRKWNLSCNILNFMFFSGWILVSNENDLTFKKLWRAKEGGMWQCMLHQGGRTWQPFVGSKKGNENFRQARIYNFCVKCVVFARNRKFANLTQWNMQHIPCNSALLAQEALFLPKKALFLPKDLPKKSA